MTLIKKIHGLLFSAHILHCCWAGALYTTTCIANRSPNIVLIAYIQKKFGHINMFATHMHIFESPSYAYIKIISLMSEQ